MVSADAQCDDLLESLRHQDDREFALVTSEIEFDPTDIIAPDAIARIHAAFDDRSAICSTRMRRSDGHLGDAEPAASENELLARGPVLASDARPMFRASVRGADLWKAAGFARTRFSMSRSSRSSRPGWGPAAGREWATGAATGTEPG